MFDNFPRIIIWIGTMLFPYLSNKNQFILPIIIPFIDMCIQVEEEPDDGNRQR